MLRNKKFLLDFNLKRLRIELGQRQEKLAEAITKGNKKEQEKLKKIIIESWGAWVLAVYKVISNKGFRSPRLSEEIPNDYEQQSNLVEQL